MRLINEIIIHCAATKPSMDIGAEWIEKVHLKRGFSSIGYHYVIKRNGLIDHGRHIAKVGAHCKGKNRHSVGVCLVGGMSEDNKPEDNFTDAQFERLREVVANLKKQFLDIKKVSGHCDYSTKPCPCFDVQKKIVSCQEKEESS